MRDNKQTSRSQRSNNPFKIREHKNGRGRRRVRGGRRRRREKEGKREEGYRLIPSF